MFSVQACGPTADSAPPGTIAVVGAENEYANVLSQIGGKYVHVTSVMNNPTVDPHSFEASPSIATAVTSAKLVVQNGLGYDGFMDKLEANSSSSRRRVIDVQSVLHVPDSDPNPHLWYEPGAMPSVARAIARDLGNFQPSHARYFQRRLRAFQQALLPWKRVIAQLRSRFRHTAVAVTEPVADYLLHATGLDIKTPFTFQADVMNGVDLPPQYVTLQDELFQDHKVKVFVYNRQVVDSTTQSFLAVARSNHIPVVGVYETMPVPSFSYQSWMLAETKALERALETGQSTQHL